jgi:hypothetical protein
MMVPAESALVSIEAGARGGGRFARARVLVEPPPSSALLTLSDLLLFEVGEALPLDLAGAAPRALTSSRVSRHTPLGVYFEVTGRPLDSLAVSVALVPERRGLLGRIGQSLSLVKRRAPLTLAWLMPPREGRVAGRAFELDLERQRNGGYWLLLTVTAPDGAEQTVQRRLELIK